MLARKRIISLLLCLSLVISSVSALASSEKSIDYTVNFVVNDEAFPKDLGNISDWKKGIEKISIKANADFKNLFTKQSLIKSETDILLNNKLLFDIERHGSQQYFWLSSKNIPDFRVFLNSYNYYEFMLKGYFFLKLPTNYVALLSYPYGAYFATKPFYELAYNSFNTNESTTIPYDTLMGFANSISNLFEDEYVSAQFFRTLLIDYGLDETLNYDLIVSPEYLETIAQDEDMQVEVSGNKRKYTLAGNEIFNSETNDKGISFVLDLPENTSGIENILRFEYKKTETGNELNAKFEALMQGSNYLSYELNADNLPFITTDSGNGRVKLKISGEVVGEDQIYELAYRWSKEEVDSSLIVKLDLGYIHPLTQKECFTISFSGNIRDFVGEVFPEEAEYTEQDFFSLNDESLASHTNYLKPYVKRMLVPMAIEMPKGIINDVWKYLDKNGLLNLLVAE